MQSKKTLVLVTSYPLDEPVVRNRLTPLIMRALARGFRVRLISGGTVTIGDDWPDFEHRCLGTRKKARRNFFYRAFAEWHDAGKLLRSARSVDYDAVLVTIPSMFLLFRSRLLPGPNKIIDIRDLTWEYLPDEQLVQRIAKSRFRTLARSRVPDFALVSCTNEAERRYIGSDLGVEPSRIVSVPNGISQAQFDMLAPAAGRSMPDAPIEVSYIGNVGVAQNLSTLLMAAKSLPHIKFNIVGGGTALDEVRAKHKDLALANVNMTGRVAWQDVKNIYDRSDILYAQLSFNFSSAMPSKLYEYLATGKYIIYGGGGEAVKMLAQFSNNEIIAPDDPGELARAITDAVASDRFRHMSSDNRRIIQESYIREVASDRLLTRVDELLGRAS